MRTPDPTSEDEQTTSAGPSFEERWIEVDDGVELRVSSSRPERGRLNPVLFVAGWISAWHGWRELMERLARDRAVFYLETREKSSARIARRSLSSADFTIERNAKDIIAACGELPVEVDELLLMGSSLGATSILEAMKRGGLSPRAAFLIGPNSRFKFPAWGGFIVHIPVAAFHPAQALIRWYLRNFRVDTKREPEQMRRYDETIRQAEPLRLKLSAQAVRGYEVWPELSTVRAPTAIAYAQSDKLHASEEVRLLAQALPGSVTVACPSNRFMHGPELASKVDEFLAGLTSAG